MSTTSRRLRLSLIGPVRYSLVADWLLPPDIKKILHPIRLCKQKANVYPPHNKWRVKSKFSSECHKH